MQPSAMNGGPTRTMAETVHMLQNTTCAAPPTGAIMSGGVIPPNGRAHGFRGKPDHDALPPVMPPA